jgi:heme-degrading monooxygenase HmoA
MSSNSSLAKCFIVLYRWRLHPGSEASFIEAWSRVSDALRSERGSLGSRLHRGGDGLWYSYAQWPSVTARDEAFALGPVDSAAGQSMKDAIAERLPEIVLECAADFLLPIQDGSRA